MVSFCVWARNKRLVREHKTFAYSRRLVREHKTFAYSSRWYWQLEAWTAWELIVRVSKNLSENPENAVVEFPWHEGRPKTEDGHVVFGAKHRQWVDVGVPDDLPISERDVNHEGFVSALKPRAAESHLPWNSPVFNSFVCHRN